MLHFEKLNAFPLRLGMSTAIQYSIANSSQCSKARKKIKGIQIKEEIKLFIEGNNPVCFMVKHI